MLVKRPSCFCLLFSLPPHRLEARALPSLGLGGWRTSAWGRKPVVLHWSRTGSAVRQGRRGGLCQAAGTTLVKEEPVGREPDAVGAPESYLLNGKDGIFFRS